jgi:hypothetical protein
MLDARAQYRVEFFGLQHLIRLPGAR